MAWRIAVRIGLAVFGVQVLLGIVQSLVAAPMDSAADALLQLTAWGVLSFIACGSTFLLAAYRSPHKAWHNMVGGLVLFTVLSFVLAQLLVNGNLGICAKETSSRTPRHRVL